MNEIGGYISFPIYNGKMLHDKGLKINNARNCLELIIREKNIKIIYLPKYICESVISVCKKNNVEIRYYLINELFQPILEEVPELSNVLIVNFYGQLEKKYLKILSKKFRIIIDNTQDYFYNYKINVPTIYSCRKYFGVPDGGILENYDIQNKSLLDGVKYSNGCVDHLIGRLERTAKEFYNVYKENEQRLDIEPLKKMSPFTEDILHSIRYKSSKKNRLKNFKKYKQAFKNINMLKINKIGTFGYPLLLKNGKEIKEYLIKNNIYIPTLWPNCISEKCFINKDYNINDLLILPCNEDLSEKEINKVIKMIKEKNL